MWILRVLDIGFYSILLWPLHIPLWCTGYLVRDKVKSPTGRWIFLSFLVAGLFLCELICWWIPSSGRWAMFIVIVVFLDLLIGYAAAALLPLFRKWFRWYMEYLENDDKTEESQ